MRAGASSSPRPHTQDLGTANRSKLGSDSRDGKAMANRLAFLVRPKRIILILLGVMCLLVPVEAQHGGGGGHSAGGHFGSGHSSGRQTGGGRTGGRHLGWLHFGFGNRSARRAGGLGAVAAPDASRQPPELVRRTTPVRAVPSASIQRVPPRPFPVLFQLALPATAFSFLLSFVITPGFSSAVFGVFRHPVASSTA